jgi:hypothetical protein
MGKIFFRNNFFFVFVVELPACLSEMTVYNYGNWIVTAKDKRRKEMKEKHKDSQTDR